jgi:class 3 adenylate cyclase
MPREEERLREGRRRSPDLLACLLVLWAASGHAQATAPLDVTGAVPVRDLAGSVSALQDAAAILTLDQVIARADDFEPIGQRDYSRPPGVGAVWLRVDVRNRGTEGYSRLFVVGARLIDTVDVYVLQGAQTLAHHRAGEDTELDERAFAHPLPVIPLSIPPGATRTVLLRVEDGGEIRAPLMLTNWPALASMEANRNVAHGIFLGGVLLLFLFSLYLALARREKLYTWFALYLGAELWLTLIYFWGGLGVIFPADLRPVLVNRTIVFGAAIVFWASLQFSATLLNLDALEPVTARRVRLVSWAYPPVLVGVLVLPYAYAVALSAAALVPVFLPVAASVRLGRAGDRVAILYAWSWGLLAAASIFAYLKVADLIPGRYPTEYTLYVGFFAQYSVLCIAMSGRFRSIERERRRALEAELAAYERNAALSRSFERFVPKAFLDRLKRQSITEIELGQCVEKRMTVLFADIRSFTTLVEKMSPEENFAFVNEYLSYMEPAIHQHLGFIDKYIGDAVMALFDDDEADDGGAGKAVNAAIGMHTALAHFNAKRARMGADPVSIGIGLHTGALMLGTIGGRDRLNASVIGDAVNLASRVEGLTKQYGAATLLTADTAWRLPKDIFQVRALDTVRVKGKSEAVEVYELLDGESGLVLARRLATREDFQDGRRAFAAGEMDGAVAAFQRVLAEDPDDRAARVLLDRSGAMLVSGVPPDWDGTTTLDVK